MTNEIERRGQRDMRLNPYGPPVARFAREAASIDWKFPFVPAVIQLLVFILLTVVCSVLYCTVGFASQIGGTFWLLIVESREHMKRGSAVERSAYAVAVGAYSAAFLFFFLIQLPFWILGWLWGVAGTTAMLLILSIVAVGAAFFAMPEGSVDHFIDWIRSQWNR